MSEFAPLYRLILYAALALITLLVLDWFTSRRSHPEERRPARPLAPPPTSRGSTDRSTGRPPSARASSITSRSRSISTHWWESSRAWRMAVWLSRGGRPSSRPSERGVSAEVPAREPLRVRLEQPVHLAHRRLGGAPVLARAQVLEDGLLRLRRLLLLDRLVHGVVLAAPLRAHAVVLDEGPADGLRDLDHLLLEQRRRAEGRAPGQLVAEPPHEVDDRGHLRARP